MKENNRFMDIRELIINHMNNTLKNFDENDFILNTEYLKEIHKHLFKDIYFNSGEYRTYNLYKEEPLLYNESVSYPDYHTIKTYLGFAFEEESKKDYHQMTPAEVCYNIAKFTRDIWLVHPFNDGNTRTVTIFIKNYLKHMGYDFNDSILEENKDYYRNALVKASYENESCGIKNDLTPLTNFYEKVVFNNDKELSEKALLIEGLYLQKEIVKKRKKAKK